MNRAVVFIHNHSADVPSSTIALTFGELSYLIGEMHAKQTERDVRGKRKVSTNPTDEASF